MPSVSSSIAIALDLPVPVRRAGRDQPILSAAFGIDGRQWFNNGEGTFHAVRSRWSGSTRRPAFLADHEFLDLSWWDWLSGPSWSMVVIIMLVIWTTSGTFMLMFLAGLQNVPDEVHEAAAIDGATAWQPFRQVTLPMLRRHVDPGASPSG